MNFYISSIVFSIVICLGICVFTVRRLRVFGAKTLLLMAIALALYSIGYLFEVLSPSLETKIIWYNIEYFGIAMLPFLWILFAFEYTGFEWALSRKRFLFLALIPVITIIMVWTNRYHGLMIQVLGISTEGALPEILKNNGPWYWVHVVYTYLLIFSGSIILLRSIFNLPPFYIKRGIILILGALIPMVGSILYIFKLTPVRSFDFIPVFTAVSGILLTWSLFRIKAFQIIPIIRDRIFDNMVDGFIVIDGEGKIIDSNKAAQKVLDFNIQSVIGLEVVKFFSERNLLDSFYVYKGSDPGHSIDYSGRQLKKTIGYTSNYSVDKEERDINFENGSLWAQIYYPGKGIKNQIETGDFINCLNSKNQVLILNPDNPEQKRFYDVSLAPIGKAGGAVSGYLLELYDITANKIIEEHLFNSRKKIETINKILYDISISENVGDVFTRIYDTARMLLGFKYASFFTYNSGVLERKFASNPLMKKIIGNDFFYNETLKNYNKNKVELIYISKTNSKYDFLNEFDAGISAVLYVPVRSIGIFTFLATGNRIIENEDIKICHLLANQSLVVLKRIWLQKTLKEQAEIDPLTGVYNRRYFDNSIDKELERAKRYNYTITFIMIDIDRFKEVNDRFGHQIGDLILKSVGYILIGQTRKIDTIIRFGGDEFLLVLPNFTFENIEGFMNRVNTAFKQWNEEIRILDFEIELSMGISHWNPGENKPVDDVIKIADSAMYDGKRRKSGRGNNA